MRLGRDQMIFMGLVALDEVLEQLRDPSYQPPFAIRAVLAMLHSYSDAPATPFADFWRACHAPPLRMKYGAVDEQERCRRANGSFRGICIALRVTETINFGEDLAAARRAPLPQMVFHSAKRRESQSPDEAARRAFADALRRVDERLRAPSPARSASRDPPPPSASS